jgi:hypothetical protein
MSAPSLDADLIRICAEHIENHAAYNARAGEAPPIRWPKPPRKPK